MGDKAAMLFFLFFEEEEICLFCGSIFENVAEPMKPPGAVGVYHLARGHNSARESYRPKGTLSASQTTKSSGGAHVRAKQSRVTRQMSPR